MVRHDGPETKPRRWAKWQIAGAFVLLAASLAMFAVQGVAPAIWDRTVDFGILPWSLLVVSVYVLFGLNLPGLFGDH